MKRQKKIKVWYNKRNRFPEHRMKYDFDQIISRAGTHSVKWADPVREDEIPMWVADMDFATVPAVTQALARRAAHGIYGYTLPPASYYKATAEWFVRRHGWAVRPQWILPVTGVVPALAAILCAMAEKGDKVILQTPVYNCFFSVIKNYGCEALPNPLIYKNNRWSMDFEDLEKKAADPKAKILFLCNPHNPAGRVWSKEELKRLGEICLRHRVFVVADEIHCELVAPGIKYTPFASLDERFLKNSVTCTSPSKAFNLAGLQAANIFAADESVRESVRRGLDITETGGIGCFGVEGLIAAYRHGADWLDQLNAYLHENFLFLKDFFAKHLPKAAVAELEGTYLVWADCRYLQKPSAWLAAQLRKGGVRVNPGSLYGADGEGFLRINIACPRTLLQTGLERMVTVLNEL